MLVSPCPDFSNDFPIDYSSVHQVKKQRCHQNFQTSFLSCFSCENNDYNLNDSCKQFSEIEERSQSSSTLFTLASNNSNNNQPTDIGLDIFQEHSEPVNLSNRSEILLSRPFTPSIKFMATQPTPSPEQYKPVSNYITSSKESVPTQTQLLQSSLKESSNPGSDPFVENNYKIGNNLQQEEQTSVINIIDPATTSFSVSPISSLSSPLNYRNPILELTSPMKDYNYFQANTSTNPPMLIILIHKINIHSRISRSFITHNKSQNQLTFSSS